MLTSGGYVQCDSEPCLFRKKTSTISIYVDDCLHTYKGTKMRTELYGTLARAKLPAPTVQQLTYNLPMFYLGKNDHLILSQRGINDLLTKYPPGKEI